MFERIKTFYREAIIESGLELIKVKEALGHGHFSDWVEAELNFSPTTARNYMRAAKVFESKTATVAVLAPGVLYAAASAPEDVQEEIMRRVGQHFDDAAILRLHEIWRRTQHQLPRYLASGIKLIEES